MNFLPEPITVDVKWPKHISDNDAYLSFSSSNVIDAIDRRVISVMYGGILVGIVYALDAQCDSDWSLIKVTVQINIIEQSHARIIQQLMEADTLNFFAEFKWDGVSSPLKFESICAKHKACTALSPPKFGDVNPNVVITPKREYIESTEHLSLSEPVALRMKNKPFKSGDIVTHDCICGTLIIERDEWFFKPMGMMRVFKVDKARIERML